MLAGRRILLIIGGGIAAYKSLELIRLLQKAGAGVAPVLTAGGAEFVTPLTVSALAGEPVHRALFDLTAEAEMGHIELSRSADLVVVAPATADLIAKLANGLANDLASTLLLATDKRVLLAPAMNVRMWQHPATRRNLATVTADGALLVGPNEGEMACGEFGPGRMAEPPEIVAAIDAALSPGTLAGRHILVTSGPTREPIDPVRYIANRSSGRQGSAIAEALARRGARVTFVTGPADAPRPAGRNHRRDRDRRRDARRRRGRAAGRRRDLRRRRRRLARRRRARLEGEEGSGRPPPGARALREPRHPEDITSRTAGRPGLVIGFAAETDDLVANATAKRLRKGADWIVANDVSPGTGIMGGTENAVTLITDAGADPWPRMSKAATAEALADRIVRALA